MKQIFIAALLFTLAHTSFAQLSGPLSGTLGPGIYHVIDTISVESNDTLRVMPGTDFIFDGPFPFQISGTLLAEGTASDSIVFTTDIFTNLTLWRGLRFVGSGSSGSRLAYCLVEHGRAAGAAMESKRGGGVYCDDASPNFAYCTFQSNSAEGWGGAVACWYASPSFASCTFHGNAAATYGGGVYSWYSSPTFTNCVLTGGWAQFGGGACCSGGAPVFTQCTFSGNVASLNGGGVYCGYSSAVFNSTVIAFSTNLGIYFISSAGSQLNYCDVFGNSGRDIGFSGNDPSNGPPRIGAFCCTNANDDSCDQYHNIFLNPMFADSASGDFHLMDESHCIGAAQTGGPNEDFEGNPCPNPPGSQPDIGAYESERSTPLPLEGLIGYLSGSLGPGIYHILGTVYVLAGGTLRLMPGTTFIFDGPFPFQISGTLSAEGTARDSIVFTTDTFTNPTLWRGLRFVGSGSSGSRLSYCLVEHGRATGAAIESKRGGGIYCDGASPAFAHCTFRSNSADLWGGAVACWNASPSFTSCTFLANAAGTHGGGIYSWYSSPTFTKCIVTGSGAQFGGGACCSGGAPVFTQCTFSGNTASVSGGGAYCGVSSPIFNSSIIAFSNGAGVYFWDSPASAFEHCDIFGNSEGNIRFSSDDSSNGPSGVGVICCTNANGDSSDAYHNIFLAPIFADTTAGDYHLLENSPCVDAGNPSLPLDPDGTVADIGAFFYSQGSPPSAFSLFSPQWGDTCWTLDTTLVWQAATDFDENDTVSYEVWLDTLSDLSTAWEIASALLNTTFYLEHLSDDRAYYWTVHASDLQTLGTWAEDTLMFHTYYPEPPEEFALTEPPNDDTVFTATPPLRWRTSFDPDPSDAIRYHLMWSYEADFSVYDDTTLADTSFTFPVGLLLTGNLANERKESPLRVSRPTTARNGSSRLDEVEDDSTVYWKVEATDRFGFTESCVPAEGWSFHVYVYELPSAFSLLQPADSAVISDITLLCCWQASHDPDPGDTVTYTLRLTAGEFSFTYETDTDTCWMLDLVEMGLVDDNVIVEWWVEAHSNYPDTTMESASHFHFYPPSATSVEDILLPKEFALHQNYPNPFNPMTTIRYDVPMASEVRLMIMNLLGQKVATLVNARQLAGSHTVLWDATNWPSGVYLCRMEAAGFVQTRKMVLVK